MPDTSRMRQGKRSNDLGKLVPSRSCLNAATPSFVPTPHNQPSPVGRPLFRFNKEDWSKKEVLISARGVHHNVMLVREVQLADKSLRRTVEAKSADMDLMVLLEGLGDAERREFLRSRWVEVVVSLQSQEDEEAENAAGHQGFRAGEMRALVVQRTPQIARILRSLPHWFVSSVTKLVVTLQFPALRSPHIPTGPRALLPSTNRHHFALGNSTHTISPSLGYQKDPNFRTAAFVAHEINRFRFLQKLDIVLAPPSNMRTPMTLPQLNCLLPFYDLDYTIWNAAWRAPFMSKSEVLKAWPLDYINGQRERILKEREVAIEEMERSRRGTLGCAS